ncbi:hypothetical protein ACA910_002015 [Epithemia clementina (nom. ined.)]
MVGRLTGAAQVNNDWACRSASNSLVDHFSRDVIRTMEQANCLMDRFTMACCVGGGGGDTRFSADMAILFQRIVEFFKFTCIAASDGTR